MGITETQSFTAVIRDVLFAKTCTLPFFEGFTARRSKQFPIEPYHLPYLGVYLVNEHSVPDGDPNAGHIRFIHEAKFGFSVQIEDNDPVALELKLDEAYWAIMNGVWRDQYVTNFLDTYSPHTGADNPDNTRFEGVIRSDRRHNVGPPRKNNETPWAELQYEPTVRYRAGYEPIIEDWLEKMEIEVVPLQHPGRVPPAEEVQRIIRKYEFRFDKHENHDNSIANAAIETSRLV